MKSVGSPNLRNNLVVVILTLDLYSEITKPKSLAKVCYTVGEKTMIETAIETCLRLNPVKIILYVSKYNVEPINRILKYKNYAKILSYSVVDVKEDQNEDPKDRIAKRLQSGIKCMKNRNILFVPGNAPLLEYKTLYKIVHDVNTDLKITPHLFYFRKDSMHMLPFIESIKEYPPSALGIDPKEVKQIETKGDLDDVVELLKTRK